MGILGTLGFTVVNVWGVWRLRMGLRAVCLLLFSSVLASCVTDQTTSPSFKFHAPIVLTSAQEKTVRDSVASSLKDPQAARFGKMIAGRSSDGEVMVCGLVNGKNSFGGYIGDKPFEGLLVANGQVFAPIGIGGMDDDTNATFEMCGKSGLQLERL